MRTILKLVSIFWMNSLFLMTSCQVVNNPILRPVPESEKFSQNDQQTDSLFHDGEGGLQSFGMLNGKDQVGLL